jgi:glycosyltransferase involved in cell wall biosynthesis
MKVLLVGGFYHAEISLGMELANNPNLQGICCGDDTGTPGWEHFIKNYTKVVTKDDIRRIKNEYKPDLTIFRSWVSSTNLMDTTDLLYSYETLVKDETGKYFGNPMYMEKRPFTAYQSVAVSKEQNEFWLPYCVSKYYEKPSTKDIPILLATNIPGAQDGGDFKVKACDILVKPIVEWNSNLLQCYSGFGMNRMPYLADKVLGNLNCSELMDHVSRAKIVLSPDCVWYNDGYMSHKTIQAMGCGCLVITNNHVGLENIIGQDGENVLYSASPEETLDKIKFYLKYDTVREKIAHRAYSFIHNEYSWEKHLMRLHQDYLRRIK